MEIQRQETGQPVETKDGKRYLLQAELLSAKVYDNNKVNQKNEYYFETGPRFSRNRIPTDGNIKLKLENQDEIPTSLTLFSRIVETGKHIKEGDTLELPIWLKRVNEDFMKLDEVVAYYKIGAKLGGDPDIINVKKDGAELKIMLSANPTQL